MRFEYAAFCQYMTYERFKELWAQAGFALVTENPATMDALVAAAKGDFSEFDKVSECLKKV